MSRKLDAAVWRALGYEVNWKKWKPDDDDAPEPYEGFEEYVLHANSRCLVYCNSDDKGAFPVIVTKAGDRDLPHCRTDGNDMLDLDKEMQARGWMVKIIFWGAMYEAIYSKPINTTPSASATSAGIFKAYSPFVDTMPEAVVLAAYKALTGKEWKP